MQQFFSGVYLWGISLLEQKAVLCWLSRQFWFLMQLSALPRKHIPNHGIKFSVFIQSSWLCVAHGRIYRLTGILIWIFVLTSGNSTRRWAWIGFIYSGFNCNSAESVAGFLLMVAIFSFIKILLFLAQYLSCCCYTKRSPSSFEVSCMSFVTLSCALMLCSGYRHS